MFKKKFYSQVFLKNNNIIKKIINKIDLNLLKNKNYCILEIGSGIGNLSKELLKITNKCIFVEIDKDLVKIFKKKIINKNLFIINKNILNIKLKKIKKFKKFFIIGNFPYNISSKLIFWLINNKKYIIQCIGTFQYNFINNFINNKVYKNKLSLYFNLFFKLKKLFNIKKNNFSPIPKVNSLVVKIIKIKKKYKNINYVKFFFFIKEIFKYKRKTLKNSLKILFKKKIKYNKLLYKRPDNIKIKDFIKLYKKYYEN
ncbi:MAG: 16S rRNA (adenine(1518)-N(6)/adenine(1519)-N(6))-dimethyltransferase [Candidatus Shikimatogenerans sp. JK-2022]|nr:16S rRNA (adenine(1518)-N(6)/adenine(1519)-N(6))-dimethyltransferase [Candidatus Shikimatogenerans bostrichidophilus]